MEIQTKLMPTEMIKPSSPTPKSLQKHHLSRIDQGFARTFMPFLYFYSSTPEIPKSDCLKKSLSETLSTYYPLAGRLVGNLYIDCNDHGVPFSEAEADSNLSQAISNPNPHHLTKFLPCKTLESQDLCMAVQVTHFHCGGVAVGLLMLHKIADAFSMIMFFNTWSAVARNVDLRDLPCPRFDGAKYFPPQDIPAMDIDLLLSKEELRSRVFSFTAAQISLLRERYSGRRRPSRVEALSAHIWSSYHALSGLQTNSNETYSFKGTANLRHWLDDLPPSEYHFGNFFTVTETTLEAGDGEMELVEKIHESKISSYKRFMDKLKQGSKRTVNMPNMFFSSLCGFPLYEADFGWGKPVLIRVSGFPLKNTIIFVPTVSGAGIEANIRMSKPDMEKFEVDFEMKPLFKSNL